MCISSFFFFFFISVTIILVREQLLFFCVFLSFFFFSTVWAQQVLLFRNDRPHTLPLFFSLFVFPGYDFLFFFFFLLSFSFLTFFSCTVTLVLPFFFWSFALPYLLVCFICELMRLKRVFWLCSLFFFIIILVSSGSHLFSVLLSYRPSVLIKNNRDCISEWCQQKMIAEFF